MEHPEIPEPAPRRDRGRGLRSGLLAAGAAFGMTLAGLGIAGAQIDSSSGESTLEQSAAAQSSEPSTADLGGTLGTTEPSAATATQTVPDPPGPELAPSAGADGPHDGVRRFGHHHHHMGARLSVAAEAIGIEESELLAQLRSGRSIAQVAEAKGVAVQKVIDAMVAAAKAHLAERVEAGELTQAQADARSADLVTRITEMVNRTGGLPHGHGGHPPFPGDPAPTPPAVPQGTTTS